MNKRSSFRVYDEVGGGVALQKSVLITVTVEIGGAAVQVELRGTVIFGLDRGVSLQKSE